MSVYLHTSVGFNSLCLISETWLNVKVYYLCDVCNDRNAAFGIVFISHPVILKRIVHIFKHFICSNKALALFFYVVVMHLNRALTNRIVCVSFYCHADT